MKVVHLVHGFPPEVVGGTESYLASLVRLQACAGLDVEVVCGSEVRRTEAAAREDFHGVPVTRLFRREEERYGVLFHPPRLQAEVAARVRAAAPDLVHLHHWFNLGDRLLQALPEARAVATLHDAYSACPRFFLLRPDGGYCGTDLPVPLERCVRCVAVDDGEERLPERLQERRHAFAREIARLERIFVPSRYHGEVLIGAGVVPRERLCVLGLGISGRLDPVPHRPDPGRLRLVTFGNLNRVKGVDLLLAALRSLPRERVELHLFGEVLEEDRGLLARLAEGLPATFHGRYAPEELAARAGGLDLAVFPSRAYESYSLVLQEAFALGLPAVTSDRGAPPELAGAGGIAVGVEDAEPLAQALRGLLEDPARLAALRQSVPLPERLEDHERLLCRSYEEVLAR